MKYILKRNIVKHYYKENKELLTTDRLQNMLTSLNNSIGASGYILVICTGFLIEQKKNISSKNNRKSQQRLIKWLYSEMRFYNDLGTFNPYVNHICKYLIKLMMER